MRLIACAAAECMCFAIMVYFGKQPARRAALVNDKRQITTQWPAMR
jgi:hypothetical protein